MRRVIIAAAVKIIIKTVMAVDMPVSNFIPEIMRVCAGAVNNRAEKLFARHRGCQKLLLAPAAVFNKHIRRSRFLLRFYKS